jgi:hypothetical protein
MSRVSQLRLPSSPRLIMHPAKSPPSHVTLGDRYSPTISSALVAWVSGSSVGLAVGLGVAVGGSGVGVAVGGSGVSVGGTGVSVGGTGVSVGGTGVLVGGMGVDSGCGAPHATSVRHRPTRARLRTLTMMLLIIVDLLFASSADIRS